MTMIITAMMMAHCDCDEHDNDDDAADDDEITTMTDFLIRFMNRFLNMP